MVFVDRTESEIKMEMYKYYTVAGFKKQFVTREDAEIACNGEVSYLKKITEKFGVSSNPATLNKYARA